MTEGWLLLGQQLSAWPLAFLGCPTATLQWKAVVASVCPILFDCLSNSMHIFNSGINSTTLPLLSPSPFPPFLQFIGSLEIARPTCKIDIITAMRRIRVSMCALTLEICRCDIALQCAVYSKEITTVFFSVLLLRT